MSTPTVSQQLTASRTPAEDGLRSIQGIRWLLFAGGLVVAVSVIRLVAAEWGVLPTAARFLTLAAGALAVFAAGDVTRRRLSLPVAGSAILFLATALVPLLAWGAAYLRLLEAPLGWPSLVLGLGALLAAGDRALRGILAYRGGAYTLASGVLLFAVPVLPYLEARWPWSPESFFLAAAGTLGLVLRGASRHVNRFFFHRDRASGIERPVHWLPFALLVLLYGAGTSLLAAFSSHLAVPWVFVAIALIDAGEEYYRALCRAAGSPPERWPRRSVALLALGFTALAASLATAPLDSGRHSLALVASLAALRLLAWAWRYRNTTAHAIGLLVGIVAYHAFPALVPEAVRDLFQLAVRALGIDPGGLGAVSFGDLGIVALLLGLAWLKGRPARGRRLTPAMQRAHAVITAACASLLLLAGLTEPGAARLVAPAAAVLLGAGLYALRWKALIPALYQALATSALAWTWSPELSGASSSIRFALALGVVHLLFLGSSALALRRRGGPPPDDAVRLLTWPPLAVAFALLLRAVALSEADLGASGILTLVAAGTLLLSGLILRRAWLFAAASLGLAAGAHCLAVAAGADAATALAVISQVLMVVYWLVSLGLARYGRGDLVPAWLNAAMVSGAASGAASIWATLDTAGSPWPRILPGFLASAFFVFMASGEGPPGGGPAEHRRKLSAPLAMGFFAVCSWALLERLEAWGPELHCLGPGLALLGLSGLLRRELDEVWRQRLFTAGATLLYAMPVLGLLEGLDWGWQIVLLLFAVAFGAASFKLRSRSLLTVSTAALVIDLACFLIKLRQTAPLLVWVTGIAFGLGLMAVAALLEHRREVLLQRIRIWGRELRSWA